MGLLSRAARSGTLLFLLALGAACSHATVIHSEPPGAQVFLGDSDEAAGTAPYALHDAEQVVRVVHDGAEVRVRLKEELDWGYAALNTAGACAASGGTLLCLGGGLWLCGTTLGAATPVLGPLIAFLGGPPAACGTLFWTVLGGTACTALLLPITAFQWGYIGPETVTVTFPEGSARSEPANRVEVLPPVEPPSVEEVEPEVIPLHHAQAGGGLLF